MARSAAEQKNGPTGISAIVASAMKKSLVHLIRRVQLGALRGRKLIGEHFGLGLIHESCNARQLGRSWSRRSAMAPRPRIFPGERGGDEGGDDAPSALAGMGQQIMHEVDAGVVEEGPIHGGIGPKRASASSFGVDGGGRQMRAFICSTRRMARQYMRSGASTRVGLPRGTAAS